MIVIMGGRASGKTFKLVKAAHEGNGIIWVASYVHKQYIQQVAKTLKIPCPPVYSAEEVRSGRIWCLPLDQRNAYIDDLESFLFAIGNGKFYIKQVVLEPENNIRKEEPNASSD